MTDTLDHTDSRETLTEKCTVEIVEGSQSSGRQGFCCVGNSD